MRDLLYHIIKTALLVLQSPVVQRKVEDDEKAETRSLSLGCPEGYSQEQIGYHVHLMDEASLLRAADVTHRQSPSPQATPISLTWEGHEFLDAARDPSRWRTALDIVREKGGVLTFEILKAVLVELARGALELGS